MQGLRGLWVGDVPLVLRGLLASTRANPAGPTQREIEVLALIAEGQRSPEIAKQLFLTPKTVSRRLTSAHSRIGVTTRTEAARLATRPGNKAEI